MTALTQEREKPTGPGNIQRGAGTGCCESKGEADTIGDTSGTESGGRNTLVASLLPLQTATSASLCQAELKLVGMGAWEPEFHRVQLPALQGPAGWGVDITILKSLLSLFSSLSPLSF